MGAITGISSNYYYTDYPGIYKNPSDSAIAERTTTQVRGMDQGTDNLKDAQSVTKIADGALEGITDYLQRIREKSLQAMNTFTLGDDERRMIQDEIDQLKQGIADIAGNTTFNEQQLLDGTRGEDFEIMAGQSGPTEKVSAANATLDFLGIKDFDVTKDFNIGDIDNALEKVTSQRGNLGAQQNRLDYATAYNQLSSYNHVASFKEDDIGSVINQVDGMRKNRLFDTIKVMMQNNQEEAQRRQTTQLFT